MKITMVVEFLILALSSITLQADESPLISDYTSPSTGRSVPLFSSVTTENIGHIFSYLLSRDGKLDQYGAKAVVVSLVGLPPTVYFFPLGEGRQYYQVHHRGVLSFAIEKQLGLAGPRLKSRSYGYEVAQGFQLQAQMIDGRMYVVGFQIDSSITSDQKSYQTPLSIDYQNWLLDATVNSIEPSLRLFSRPEWPKRLNWSDNTCRGILEGAAAPSKEKAVPHSSFTIRIRK